MIWFLSIILIVIYITIYVILNNKNINRKNDKNQILKIIVVINIIVVCLLQIILPFARDINLYGLIIFLLVNIIVLFLSKKLSKSKYIFIVTIVAYFIIVCIIPLYKFENHRHIFNHDKMYTMQMLNGEQMEFPEEIIEEYTIYYNCYNIKLLER